jgi:hypothetical protein
MCSYKCTKRECFFKVHPFDFGSAIKTKSKTLRNLTSPQIKFLMSKGFVLEKNVEKICGGCSIRLNLLVKPPKRKAQKKHK